MSDEARIFLDTNILAYAAARDGKDKQRLATDLVETGFREGGLVVSTQVLLELYVTLTRDRFRALPEVDALTYVESLLAWTVVDTTGELVVRALKLAQRFQISTWDAAILQAALEAGCSKVLSEDLSSGQDYGGVMVENPFVQPAA